MILFFSKNRKESRSEYWIKIDFTFKFTYLKSKKETDYYLFYLLGK